MSRASHRFSAALAAAALASTILAAVVATPAAAYPSSHVQFEGRGWGHGRGLGQYGALGYAVDESRPYSWIVDHFYGGTTKGTRADGPITVRLTEFDDRDMIVSSASEFTVHDGTGAGGVVIPAGTAALVRHTATGYEVHTGAGCGGPTWTKAADLGATASPTAATTYTGDDVTKMLRACGPTGNLRSYRGTLKMVASATSTWVVNTLGMEQYLRGVVPRESPASWGDLGSGKGLEALKAQAVAARSYAWAESRSALFKTCDTISCQVYGGAGLNGVVTEDRRSDAAIAATAGEVRLLANGSTARTEFSSSTGGHTAGGTFTAVPDDGDDITSNPNRQWSTKIEVTKIEQAYPEIGALRSVGVTRRNGLGADGGRALEVRLAGATKTVTATGDGVRSKLGLKSDWFTAVDVVLDVTRLQGTDRAATANAVSADQFAAGAAGGAVIVSSANYPDALVGVPLAVDRNAPILLSGADRVSDATMAELQRATGGTKPVFLLGGTAALGAGVEQQLKAAGYPVTRYGGASRYATAVLVAEALGNPTTILEATGTGFADALAAGAAAAKASGAVLLTAGSQQAPETAAYLQGKNVTRYAVGGGAAAADPGATALSGADRYATAVAVANKFFPGPVVAGLASGTNYPDALSGGVHAARKGGPLVLTASTSLPLSTKQYLQGNSDVTLTKVYVYGGPSAVSDQVITALKTR